MSKPRALLIAEKPSAMEDAKRAFAGLAGFPYDVDFTSAAGHLVSLVEPQEYSEDWGQPWTMDVIPIIPQHWKTKVVNKLFYNIQELVNNNHYDILINCCDCGREGEHIFYSIYEKLHLTHPVMRMWFDDQTEDELRRAFNNLRPASDFVGYRYASKLRARFDWLFGMNFSRVATLKTTIKLPVGRCITVMLAMIVYREIAIATFVPQSYFELEVTFQTLRGEQFNAFLVNPNNEEHKFRFDKREELFLNFSAEQFAVQSVEQSKLIQNPKRLYDLSTLQTDCNRIFKYPIKKTLDVAQSLYEKKLISYPRTESQYLTTGLVEKLPSFLQAIHSIPEYQPYTGHILANPNIIDSLGKNSHYVNNKKVADHHALTPTAVIPDFSKLSIEEQNVYHTIAKRFLALFLPPCVFNKTDVSIVSTSGYTFLTSGKSLENIGWKVIYGINPKDKLLPVLTNGETVYMPAANILDKQTLPPKHYTEASFVEAMKTAGKDLDDEEMKKALEESEGIGTASTRGELMEKIIKYQWVSRSKQKNGDNHLLPTQKGFNIVKALNGQSILSPELTAEWEKKLRDLEKQNTVDTSVYDEMVAYITNTCVDLWESLPVLEAEKPTVVGTCPNCGKDVLGGQKSYYCQGITERDPVDNPMCTFRMSKSICGTSIKEADVTTLLSTGMTPKILFHWGKDKGSSHAQLMLAQSEETGRIVVTWAPFEDNIIGACPKCGGQVVEKNKGYFCDNENCNIRIYKDIYHAKISSNDAKKLIALKSIKKKCTWSTKRTSETEIKLSLNQGVALPLFMIKNEQSGGVT